MTTETEYNLIYDIGTVSVTVDGIVTGTGVYWEFPNVRQFDFISVDGSIPQPINSVTDATHLVVKTWNEGAKTNVGYVIYQISPLRFVGAKSAADVDEMLARLNTEGWYRYVNPLFAGPTEQGLTANEGQLALKYTTGQLWIMSGGVWVFVGIYRGFAFKGPWSNIASYFQGDVVSYNNSSYIAIQNSTNVLPTDTAYWMLNAGKGDTGETGATGPKGDKGDSGTLSVGSVTTLPPGSSATVTNVGTPSTAVLNFELPTGPQGQGIQPNATGSLSDRATYDSSAKGFVFMQTNTIPVRLYIKASNASGDWAGPTYIGSEIAIGDWGSITDVVTISYDFGSIA